MKVYNNNMNASSENNYNTNAFEQTTNSMLECEDDNTTGEIEDEEW